MSDPVRDPPAPAVPAGVLALVIAGIADFAANTVRQGLTGLAKGAVPDAVGTPPNQEAPSSSPALTSPTGAESNAPILFLALVGVALLAAVLAPRGPQAPVEPGSR